MATYRKIPVEIEAVQWMGSNLEAVQALAGSLAQPGSAAGFEGEDDLGLWDALHDCWVRCKKGQWVIKGIKGEVYPCDDDVFQRTYEPV